MYALFIGPVITLAKIILTYFGFYLYTQTHLKGSLLTALGLLLLALSHAGSQLLFRMSDLRSIYSEIRLIATTMNITGYLLFTIGFATLAINIAQRFKKLE